MIYRIDIKTKYRDEFVEITGKVAEIVKLSGVKDGICTVFVPHTTAGVTINENADPDVVRDLLYELDKLVPHEDGYHHVEGNSAAHLKTAMVGSSEQIILKDGKLVLGTGQGIYFTEFDGPRSRKIFVNILGE